MKTPPPVAPSAFIVAITSRLRARWLATALATPMPPTRSVVRPTSVRNWLKRSTLRSSAGEAFIRVRISQPACGNWACACFSVAVTAASLELSSGKRRRYCQRTRLPGCSNPVPRNAVSLISTRGPRPSPPASLSGSLVSAARNSIAIFPIVMRSPIFRSSRVNSAGSTAAPKAPAFCANTAASGIAGAVATLPNSG